MIYSASRRTDLVAFYPDYIVQKVARSRKLDAIVFWTKDPRNLVAHPGLRAVAERYPAVVHLTVTGLGGTAWEPGVPEPKNFSGALVELSSMLPEGALVWRFDPVIDAVSGGESVERRFARVFGFLKKSFGYPPAEVTLSFPDAYKKVLRRLAADGLAFPETTAKRRAEIVHYITEDFGMTVNACCEPELLELLGVDKAKCVDGERFDRLYGTSFGAMEKDFGQRKGCGCVQSTDIGSYEQLCGHNCRYCYARPEE